MRRIVVIGVLVGCGEPGATPAIDATAVGAVDGAPATVDASPPPSDAFLGGGDLVYTMTFQDDVLAPQVLVDEVADDSVNLVPAPWDAARQALRVRVRNGDDWNGSGYPRSEVHAVAADVANLAWDTRYRITGALWFAPDAVFPTDGDYGVGQLVAGFQLHGDDGVPPVLAFHLQDGELRVDYRPTDGAVVQDDVAYGPMPHAQRLPYEVVYQGATDATGYLRVTIGDHVVLERSGPSNRAGNETAGYAKFGLYDYWHTVDDVLDLYLDDVRFYRY